MGAGQDLIGGFNAMSQMLMQQKILKQKIKEQANLNNFHNESLNIEKAKNEYANDLAQATLGLQKETADSNTLYRNAQVANKEFSDKEKIRIDEEKNLLAKQANDLKRTALIQKVGHDTYVATNGIMDSYTKLITKEHSEGRQMDDNVLYNATINALDSLADVISRSSASPGEKLDYMNDKKQKMLDQYLSFKEPDADPTITDKILDGISSFWSSANKAEEEEGDEVKLPYKFHITKGQAVDTSTNKHMEDLALKNPSDMSMRELRLLDKDSLKYMFEEGLIDQDFLDRIKRRKAKMNKDRSAKFREEEKNKKKKQIMNNNTAAPDILQARRQMGRQSQKGE